MSLHAILDAIRAAGQEQVAEIERQTARQVDDILRKARQDSDKLYQATFAEAVEPATKERSRIIHKARLEALHLTGQVREGLVDAALEQTRGYLAGLRTDTRYPAVLRALTLEALSELAGEDADLAAIQARLEADPRDREVLENLIQDLGLNLTVSYSLNCWGGLVVKSEDECVVVINTLEARLERALPYLRSYLAALFEEEACPVSNTGTPVYAP